MDIILLLTVEKIILIKRRNSSWAKCLLSLVKEESNYYIWEFICFDNIFSLTTDEIVIYTVFSCFLLEGIQLNKISYSELIFSRTSKIKWLPNFFLGTWYPNYWSDVNVYCTVMCMCCYRVYCEKRLVKLSLYLQNIFKLGRKKGTKGLMTRKIINLV